MLSPRLNLQTLSNRLPYLELGFDNEKAVSWHEGLRAWVISGYEECLFVETHEDKFGVILTDLPEANAIRGQKSVARLEGGAHQQLHSFLSKYFSQSREPNNAPLIRSLVDDQLAKLALMERVEIAADFADELALKLILQAIGLPWDNESFVKDCQLWDFLVGAWLETHGEEPHTRSKAIEAAMKVRDVMRGVIRHRRDTKENDLISGLWSVGPSILDGWGEEEVLDQCCVLFLAGNQVVSHLISTVVYLLLSDDKLRKQTMCDPAELLPKLIEESVRLYPPTQPRLRVAKVDLLLGTKALKMGDWVFLNAAAANRDPRRYPDADNINLSRPGISSHLSFNAGTRHCVGAQLARVEVFHAVSGLFTRFTNIALDAKREKPKFVGSRFRGFRPLHALLR